MPQPWMDWAIKLQSLAQAGLYYTKDPFDAQRFEQIRTIAAEMLQYKTDLPMDTVREMFCSETGYQTPKLDTRAAVFREDKILLVRESNGAWALPGGWCDVDATIKENTVREVLEEAGLTVRTQRVIAIQDQDTRNLPIFIHKICKVFVLCTLIGGSFRENIETTAADWFPLDALPPLSEDRTTAAQIKMCFDAYHADTWETLLD